MNAARLRKTLNRQKGECTWCGKPVPPRYRTWCSQVCVDAFRREHDWPYIRTLVLARDHGVCASCGVDCVRLRRLCRMVRHREGWDAWRYLARHYGSLGWPETTVRDMWEAHHIVERVRGGGNELSNLVTVCVPCHKRETARLAAERAAARRKIK